MKWLYVFQLLATVSLADSVVDDLPQAQLQEIFHRLQGTPLSAAKLTDDELNRAAVQGLLARMGPGFSILPTSTDEKLPTKLVSELLSEEIGYLRPATFTLEELTAADQALEALAKSTATTLIIDLRSPAAPGNADVAAAWLSRFLPPDTKLFQVRTSAQQPPQPFLAKEKQLWTKPVLLLVDQEISNVAEAVAAVLRRTQHCFLVGTATPGQPIGYRTQALSDKLQMRWAESELLLDDQTSLYQHGLKPDLEARMDPAIKRRQFLLSETGGMKRFAYEPERPRLNEAALVARTNPELEYRIAQSAHQSTPFDTPAARDPVLQQALDYLVAQVFLKSAPTEAKAPK